MLVILVYFNFFQDCGLQGVNKVRFVPLVRRWTFDCLEGALTRPEISNICIRDEKSRSQDIGVESSSCNLLNVAAMQRSRRLLSMAEGLKDDVVRTIIEGGTRMVVSVGLLPSATHSTISHYVTDHFRSLPARYPLSVDMQSILQDMALLAVCRQKKSDVVRCTRVDVNIFQITIACPDRPKVYNRVSAALDLVASNILEADIMTSTSGFVSSFIQPILT